MLRIAFKYVDLLRAIRPAIILIHSYMTILLRRPLRSLPRDDQVRAWGNRALAFRAANDFSRFMEDMFLDSMV